MDSPLIINSAADRRCWPNAALVLVLAVALLAQLSAQACAFDAIDVRDPASPAVTSLDDLDKLVEPGYCPDVPFDPGEDLIAGLRSVLVGRSKRVDLKRGTDVHDEVLLRQMGGTQRSVDRSMRSVDDSVRRMNTSINAIRTYERLFRR